MIPSLKKLQAKAEDLFAEACRLRGYAVERLSERQDAKTPDFRVRLGQSELIAEVKSPGLEEQLKQRMQGSKGTLVLRPGRRVRKLIKASEDQLAGWISQAPKILVICDLRHFLPGYPTYPLYGFNDGDLAAGMFGEMVFHCKVQNGHLTHDGPQFGGNRTLRHDRYTHVSAVALLLVGGGYELGPFRAYHNPFAIHPLPAEWFQQSGDRQFHPAIERGQVTFGWKERCVE